MRPSRVRIAVRCIEPRPPRLGGLWTPINWMLTALGLMRMILTDPDNLSGSVNVIRGVGPHMDDGSGSVGYRYSVEWGADGLFPQPRKHCSHGGLIASVLAISASVIDSLVAFEKVALAGFEPAILDGTRSQIGCGCQFRHRATEGRRPARSQSDRPPAPTSEEGRLSRKGWPVSPRLRTRSERLRVGQAESSLTGCGTR